MTDNPAIRLLASDMDGTLLTEQHVISEVTKATLYNIAAKYRIPFVFATGRHHLSVTKARAELAAYFHAHNQTLQSNDKVTDKNENIVAEDFYLISSNGARVHDPAGCLILERNINSDIVHALYNTYGIQYTSKRSATARHLDEAGKSPKTPVRKRFFPIGIPEEADEAKVDAEEAPEDVVSTSAYTTDSWYMSAGILPEAQMLEKFGQVPWIVPYDENSGKESVFADFPLEGVGKLSFRCTDRNLLNTLEEKIIAQFGDALSVSLSSNTCLDVMAAGVSKASALREVGDLLGIPLAQMVAFGDSMNDREMLAAVGHGFVMRNAQPRLKAALPQCPVVGHHQEDGVALKLMELLPV